MSEPPQHTPDDRLERQLSFIREVDRLKQIERQTLLLDRSRRENDAEHSWHLALMSIILDQHAAASGLNLLRVMQMVTIHDLVEIDAGDTYAYDGARQLDKREREQQAADRIFGLLPDDQARWMRELWEEFEDRSTGEAQFAAALDCLQPVLHNYHTDGKAWREHNVHVDQVRARARAISDGAPSLGHYTQELLDDAARRGDLRQ